MCSISLDWMDHPSSMLAFFFVSKYTRDTVGMLSPKSQRYKLSNSSQRSFCSPYPMPHFSPAALHGLKFEKSSVLSALAKILFTPTLELFLKRKILTIFVVFYLLPFICSVGGAYKTNFSPTQLPSKLKAITLSLFCMVGNYICYWFGQSGNLEKQFLLNTSRMLIFDRRV